MNKRNWILRAGGVCLLWATAAVGLPAQRPAPAPPAPTFTTLHSFDGTDGNGPSAGLVQGTGGHLYGTTGNGGANNAGTVFEMTPSGVLASLYSFCARRNCADGASLYAGLVQDTRGTFYGTTALGGGKGAGTVFKITPNGRLRRLHSFDVSDGLEPLAGLVQATNGDFYGTTSSGGFGPGTVFKITPTGRLTTLHNFVSREGEAPYAGLIQGANGNLYGTTTGGGALNNGTVFTVTLDGALTTLHSFDGTDGAEPVAGLVQGTSGDFYGTTAFGGANNACNNQDAGCGTVFKMTPSGKLTTLYSFCSQTNCTDGGGPLAALVQATNGKFYGTTEGGGANRTGTVFSLSVGLGPYPVRVITPTGKLQSNAPFTVN